MKLNDPFHSLRQTIEEMDLQVVARKPNFIKFSLNGYVITAYYDKERYHGYPVGEGRGFDELIRKLKEA